MKKYVWMAILLAACNNNQGNNDTAATKDSTVKSESKINSTSTGNCDKMIFFQKGSEMDAKTYDGSGKVISSQHTKVTDVKSEGGMTVAYVEGSDVQSSGKTSNLKLNYKCDGNNIYFDIASMLRSEAKEGDASFEGSVIEYPINVSPGETLPDATGTMSFGKNGKKMTVTYNFKDRKVGGKEDVTTSAGTWSCYKISHTVEADMEMPDMDARMKQAMKSMKDKIKTTSATWFAPDFGIVKMEMYQNGKPVSKTEITGVKK